jgi:hypothetical protein
LERIRVPDIRMGPGYDLLAVVRDEVGPVGVGAVVSGAAGDHVRDRRVVEGVHDVVAGAAGDLVSSTVPASNENLASAPPRLRLFLCLFRGDSQAYARKGRLIKGADSIARQPRSSVGDPSPHAEIKASTQPSSTPIVREMSATDIPDRRRRSTSSSRQTSPPPSTTDVLLRSLVAHYVSVRLGLPGGRV